MIPKIFNRPYSSVYVEELGDYTAIYEIARAVFTKTPIQRIETRNVYNVIKRKHQSYYVFGDDYSIPFNSKLRFINQVYTLYALGATYEELCNNDISRFIEMFESVPYHEVTHVFTTSHYHRFTQLFTKDTVYMLPTWYYVDNVKDKLKEVYVVNPAERYKPDIPIPYMCFFMHKWLQYIPFEFEIPLEEFRLLEREIRPHYTSTPPVVMSAKCRRKDWNKLFFDIEILLPSYADRKYINERLKVYDQTALDILTSTVTARGYEPNWFECSRKQYANGALFYTFAIKSSILDILKQEGFEE